MVLSKLERELIIQTCCVSNEKLKMDIKENGRQNLKNIDAKLKDANMFPDICRQFNFLIPKAKPWNVAIHRCTLKNRHNQFDEFLNCIQPKSVKLSEMNYKS